MIKGMVSCIIPTYKRSETLIRAINSALLQTYKDIEVLVIDDNDPDDEFSLIVQKRLTAINDSRLRYIQQEKHINGAVARNVGIRSARGEYIAFLDDDDEWSPQKIEKQVSVLLKDNKLGGVSVLYTHFINGKPYRKCYPYTSDNMHRKVLDRSVSVFTSTIMLRKRMLEETCLFNESLKRHQDLQLLLDFLYLHSIQVIPEYLVKLNSELGENRPSTENFIKIKNKFLEVAQIHFNLYDKKTQNNIYAAHYFEIVFSSLKEGKLGIMIQYLLKIGFNFSAYKNVYRRYNNRKYKND